MVSSEARPPLAGISTAVLLEVVIVDIICNIPNFKGEMLKKIFLLTMMLQVVRFGLLFS